MRTFISLVLLALLPAIAVGTEIEREEARVKMEQFKTAHPDAIFSGQQFYDTEGFFEYVGSADTIFGTPMSTGDSPLESAWNLYSQLEDVYVADVGVLVPGKQIGAMWDKDNNSYRFTTFRFEQTFNNIPVFRSGIGFLVRNEADFPVVMTSNNFKEMQGFDAAAAAFVLPKATAEMLASAGRMLDAAGPIPGVERADSVLENGKQVKALPVVASEEKLVIWSGITNVRVEPELAIVFFAQRGSTDDWSTYQRHLVVAAVDDGEVLYSENQVVGDVSGTVSGRAPDGDAALECHPDVPFALPYAELQILGGSSTFADENGDFSIPASGSGNVTVRSPLAGQWFEVEDDSIGDAVPFLDFTVAANGSLDVLHNPNETEFDASNVNCYLHANIVRDFVLALEPNFPTIANQESFLITSNRTNISGITSCNAVYNGFSINFMRNLGNCNNTSIPDVVYHEYGHHLVNVTGNSQGQFGEGSGDTIGVLIEDDPELALGFFEGNCGSGIRSATNFRTFPCFDQASPHDCGQLLSGCVWDTLNEIRSVDPTNARDITAGLFVGMLIVRGQSSTNGPMIGPEVANIFLMLDDDDDTLANGTPHYQQIADAFNPHNFEVPPLPLFDITFPNGQPTVVDSDGGTVIDIDVEFLTQNPDPNSGILHVDTGSGFQQSPITQISGTSYSAIFPTTTCGVTASYFVTFETTSGTEVSAPADAPATVFSAISGVQFDTAFLDSFESDTGWSVSGNASDGQWERGIPNNGDRGDPSDDAETGGAGFCFVTDNGNIPNDNTDVDGGSTILTSPVLDATASADEVPFITYFRWYDNSFGGSPMADIFEVEISNNGGATWVDLETVGPAGPEVTGGWIQRQFQISDFVAPTNNMRIRFIASDLGEGSVIEAGVDGVSIELLSCSDDMEVIHGDVNMDGVVNLLDVGPFIDILNSGGFQAEADVNKDGVVNLLDVNPFIDVINGG